MGSPARSATDAATGSSAGRRRDRDPASTTGAAGLAVGAQPAAMHLAAMQGAISGAGITAGTMDAQPMMVDFSGALQMGATVMLPNGIEVPAVSAVALEAQQARIAAAQHAHAQMAAAHQQAQMQAMRVLPHSTRPLLRARRTN